MQFGFLCINGFKHSKRNWCLKISTACISFLQAPPPLSQFGRFTAYCMSKTQLKGGRHKEMTPERKLVLGRALAGRKSMGGNTSIRGNGTMGGRRGSKAFFLFFFYAEKWCICFTQGEKKQRPGGRGGTHFWTSFEKKQVLWWGWVVWLRFVLSNCAEACVAVFQVSF